MYCLSGVCTLSSLWSYCCGQTVSGWNVQGFICLSGTLEGVARKLDLLSMRLTWNSLHGRWILKTHALKGRKRKLESLKAKHRTSPTSVLRHSQASPDSRGGKIQSPSWWGGRQTAATFTRPQSFHVYSKKDMPAWTLWSQGQTWKLHCGHVASALDESEAPCKCEHPEWIPLYPTCYVVTKPHLQSQMSASTQRVHPGHH